MDGRLAALSVSALLLLAASPLSGHYATEDLVELAKPAVVTVTVFDDQGRPFSMGSGFFVDKTHVITNWHVVRGGSSARIRCADGKVYVVDGLAGTDKVADLVRLQVGAIGSRFSPLKLSTKTPRDGEKVVAIGAPQGLLNTVTDGIVSSVRESEHGVKMIQISAPISQGSSGGPVLNLDGEVVGVVVLFLKEGQNLNFAISSEHVRAMKLNPLVALGASTPTGPGAGPSGPQPAGPRSPDFTLPTLGGQSFTLSSQFGEAGNVVVLVLWATWCPPCRAEVPHLISLHGKYQGQPVTIVAVALDDRMDVVAAFAGATGIAYVVAHDPRAAVLGRAYAIHGIPATYIIDRNGVVRCSHAGFPRDANAAMGEAARFDAEIRGLL